ncbi:MAG: glycosyltransferase [Flavobacterium sp.]|nr:MAG: glycosyltransferase [Flavobacterium sp.]
MSNKAIQFNSRKEKYLLFVGQISHHKGVESLLNAFNEIGTRYLDFKLKIVGDTKDQLYKEHIQSIAYEANLNERIEFLGNLEEATVYDLMSRAYFIVVPSLFEGFGRITVEAIFNGCFVLGRNSGGTKEILTTTPGGILFDDDEHLITIMEDLMANGMERFFEKMIYIQQEASELYSNEQNVSKILSLYHKILNR